MKAYVVDSAGRVSLRNVKKETLRKYYFTTEEKVYVYRKARFLYDPQVDTFYWEGAQRKNRRSGRKAYLYVRAEPSRKAKPKAVTPEKLMEVIVQGNAVTGNETAAGVYFEGYIYGDYSEEEAANVIFGRLSENGIKLFRSPEMKDANLDRISVNFVENPKGRKLRYSMEEFAEAVVDEVKKGMHPAKKYEGGHHPKRRREQREEYKKEWEGE